MSGGLLLGGAGPAQKRAQPFRIGALTSSWGPTPAIVALRDGLLALGYREGEQFEHRCPFYARKSGRTACRGARAGPVWGGPHLRWCRGGQQRRHRWATSQIPIVFAEVGDPLGSGLIQSFARPGGNITGVADLRHELGPKRLEVFKEYSSRAYSGSCSPTMRPMPLPWPRCQVYRDAAHRLGIELVEKAVHTEEEAQATLAAVRKGEVDGRILSPDSTALNIGWFRPGGHRPASHPEYVRGPRSWAEQGGLASYGPDLYDSGRQAVRLVDKILTRGGARQSSPWR